MPACNTSLPCNGRWMSPFVNVLGACTHMPNLVYNFVDNEIKKTHNKEGQNFMPALLLLVMVDWHRKPDLALPVPQGCLKPSFTPISPNCGLL